MTLRSPWRRLWDELEAAKTRLWDAEARAYTEFLKAQRMAIEAYAETVDPGIFDQYGQVLNREAEG